MQPNPTAPDQNGQLLQLFDEAAKGLSQPTAAAGTPSPAVAQPEAPPANVQTPSWSVGGVLGDIGTGITELPRAAVKGARDAAQETMDFAADVGGYISGTDLKAPQLPDLNKPKSVTGQFATSISQFVTGMVGAGKLLQGVGVAKKIAGAGKAVRVGAEVGKASAVGAVAFDPMGPRLSDLVENHLPVLSNPVTRYLMSDPTDSRAEGRLKNALESIGMDGVLIGTFSAGAKAFKLYNDFKAGKATSEQLEAAVQQAMKAQQAADAQAAAKAPAEDLAAISQRLQDEATALNPEGQLPPQAMTAEVPPAAVVSEVPPAAMVSEAAPARPLEVVQSPTAGAPEGQLPPKPKMLAVADEDLDGIMKGLREDADAIEKFGSWESAFQNGHRFGRGKRIPWQKMASEVDSPDTNAVEMLIARVADRLQEQTDKVRGGNAKGVQTDQQVRMMIGQRAKLWGEDPAALMGMLEAAGKNSRSMAANMEASFLVGQRVMQDAYTSAMLIRAGELSRWGGDAAAAQAELRQLLEVGSTVFAQGAAMRANAGRTLRRSRAEFAPSPGDVAKLKGLDGDKLVEAMVATGGDARAIKRLANPSLGERLMDSAEFLLVNNLLWGWRTHVVNFTTNAYMVAARPLERVMGSMAVGGSEGARIRSEAWKQYTYMGSALSDAWGYASQAWARGDSVLAPHSLETNKAGINSATFNFKPWDSLSNIIYNATVVPLVKSIGVPTRALGTVDELVQQTVYRSKVLANAHVEGAEKGLAGKDLTDYVHGRLFEAFDASGRATDARTLQEARTTVFQQDLLPGTMGAGVQNLVSNFRPLRIILPFVRTPTNVLRYGWKMTPGLNLLQTEYRQMISGRMGPEAQAQAVGQMAMGSLFMAYAGFLAGSGMITGGGPTDRKARDALMATGWQPYSFVVPNSDGSKKYVNFGRFDPVAMPLGMIADIADAAAITGDPESDTIQNMAAASMLSIVKQLSSKTYLQSLNQAIDAVMDPDRNLGRASGSMAANFVPFSSALNMVNPDPHMREAREFQDRIMARLPGYSEKLPAKRDAFGDPIRVNKGLWVTGARDAVDREIERMADSQGLYIGSPSPNVGDVDLRDVTMKNGANAYERYQVLAGQPTPRAKPLKDVVATLMETKAYQDAPDGDAAVQGTKLFMLGGVLQRYREAALRQIKADPNVMEAISKRQLDVVNHYRAKQAPKPPEQQGRDALQRLGSAFGVDLQGVMPSQP
jgi:hypothetical protein